MQKSRELTTPPDSPNRDSLGDYKERINSVFAVIISKFQLHQDLRSWFSLLLFGFACMWCVCVFQNVHVSVWMCVAVRYLFSITSPVAVWQANSGLPAPSSNGSQPGSAPSAPQVPDIPVVRRARETGYSDEQIAEGIEKLRIIGKTGQGICWCCCQLERLVSYHWLDWSGHVLMLLSAGAIGQLCGSGSGFGTSSHFLPPPPPPISLSLPPSLSLSVFNYFFSS